MRLPALALTAAFAAVLSPVAASAQMVEVPGQLKPYNVTIRRFDPAQGPRGGTLFVLPVDSPDAEHAIASTIANASAFSKKADNGRPLPVAFMAVKVEPRR